MAAGTRPYFDLVAEVIASLERGVMPFRQPWVVQAPTNLASRHRYRGVTRLMLTLRAEARGYASPFWVTADQARRRGGRVRAGEEGRAVRACSVYWREYFAKGPDGRPQKRWGLSGRDFALYNVEQTMGLGRLLPDDETLGLFASTRAQRLAHGWKGAPPVDTHLASAFYRPSADRIAMPARSTFTSDEEYWSTLFHEMIHATGHQSRLARLGQPGRDHRFGSEDYAFEELVAELGAKFLCSEAGIANACAQNNSAYIGSWLARLRGDRRQLHVAASLAEKACDMILGRSRPARSPGAPTVADGPVPTDDPSASRSGGGTLRPGRAHDGQPRSRMSLADPSSCRPRRRTLAGLGGVVLLALGTGVAAAEPIASPPEAPMAAAAPAPAATEEAFADARRSIVTLTVKLDERRSRYGTGVIVRLRDGTATIATARHVVDANFGGAAIPGPVAQWPVSVRFGEGAPTAAVLEWTAPHGIDLALLSARVPDPRAREAEAVGRADLGVGDVVWMLEGTFAAAKPNVTPRRGIMREVRDVVQDGYAFRLLQSDLPIGPGDSGSGLYDDHGRLVAVQTMRALAPPGHAGAVSFSIPVEVLFDLAPGGLGPRTPPFR